MNGFVGIVYSDVFHMSNFLDPMLDTVSYRSNAKHEICKIKNVQFAASGLSILSNHDKSVFGILNGHIHEDLIASYAKWGTKAFDKLNGDFSLLLFDQKNGNLFLVRDRIGKKPLYWYKDDHHLIFATDLKALLASGIVPQTPARDGLAAYFYLGYIPQDMSPIQNVNKLLPAHYLEFHTSGTKFIRPYWSYSSCFKNLHEDPKQVAENLDHLLQTSVANNLNFVTGNVGCAISGGLGSASIAHYLKGKNEVGFSAGFQGQNEEDIRAAGVVAKTLKIPHEVSLISPKQGVNSLLNIVWHLDEPLADPNILATWELFKLAGQKTGAIFSGMGSDELLAGHTRYTLTDQPYPLWQKNRFAKSLLVPLLKVVWRSALLSMLKRSRSNPSHYHYLSENELFTEKMMNQAAPKLKSLFDPESFLNKFQKLKSNRASYVYFDVKTRLPDCYLLQYERLSAAHHLDLFTPFLDRHVIEYLASIFDPEWDTSSQLKQILSHVYPKEVLERPKVTRPQFLESWYYDPEVFELFKLLPQGVLVENGIVSKKWLQGGNSFRALFAVLVLEIWYRLYITHPITPLPPDISVKELLLMRS